VKVWIVSSAVLLGGCTSFASAAPVDEGSSTGSETVADDSEGGDPPGSESSAGGTSSTDPTDPTNPDPSSTTADPTDPTSADSTSGDGTSDTSSSSSGGDGSSTGEPPVGSCGDGMQQEPEVCDDGNGDELDGCTSACLPGPTGIDLGTSSETDLLGGGSTTAIQNAVENCPPNEALVGLGGGISMEGWLGVIGGRCRPIGLINADPPAFRTNGPVTDLPEHGQFQSGGPWQTECPDDQVVVAVRGGAGDVMDGLQIRCADVQTVGDPGAYALDPVAGAWEAQQGGSGGDDFGPLACPAGSVAVGLQTETNSYVIRLRLLCREISLAY